MMMMRSYRVVSFVKKIQMFQGAGVNGVCVERRNDQVIDGCLCSQLTACVAQVGAQAWWCLRVLIGIYIAT